MLPESEIHRLAKLSKLALSNEEVTLMQHDLANILTMIQGLQAVDTEGVAPMIHPHDPALRTRIDVVSEVNQRDAYQSVAPQAEGGFYVVPQVIES
jgi:aspartyl-tRNA(Asn)/glutamyl-tRNA(Gln) amidotransferase subunit C